MTSAAEEFSMDLNLTVELAPESDHRTKYQPEPLFLDLTKQVLARFAAAILFMKNVTTSK